MIEHANSKMYFDRLSKMDTLSVLCDPQYLRLGLHDRKRLVEGFGPHKLAKILADDLAIDETGIGALMEGESGLFDEELHRRMKAVLNMRPFKWHGVKQPEYLDELFNKKPVDDAVGFETATYEQFRSELYVLLHMDEQLNNMGF